MLMRTMALALGIGLLAGAAGALSGCAGVHGAGTSLAGLSEGTTAVRVQNHLASPAELDRITIVVDGEIVPLSAIPPEGGDVATVAVLHLAPGSHTIAIRIRAHAPSGEVIVVGAQQPFLVQDGPAAIGVDVRTAGKEARRGPTAVDEATPVVISLAIQGGRMAPEIGDALPDEKDARCAQLLPIPRALCRAAVDLDEATRKNDISAALCVKDKLAEMRKLALVNESGKGDGPALAEAQVVAISRQVELCIGQGASPAPDGVTVIPPRAR